jgi:hypothetical protein
MLIIILKMNKYISLLIVSIFLVLLNSCHPTLHFCYLGVNYSSLIKDESIFKNVTYKDLENINFNIEKIDTCDNSRKGNMFFKLYYKDVHKKDLALLGVRKENRNSIKQLDEFRMLYDCIVELHVLLIIDGKGYLCSNKNSIDKKLLLQNFLSNLEDKERNIFKEKYGDSILRGSICL